MAMNNNAFYPPELVNIYQLDYPVEERVDIAIVAFAGGYTNSDLALAWEKYQLPVIPNVIDVSVDGGSNNPGIIIEADRAVTRDIEIIGGVTPNSNIYVFFGPADDPSFRYNTYHAAIYHDPKPRVIVSSFYDLESDLTLEQIHKMNDLYAEAAQMGITIAVPSAPASPYVPAFPQTSPFVLCCTGTVLKVPNGVYCDPETEEYVTKLANRGFSKVFLTPEYQYCENPNKYRSVPDVAIAGSPETGILIVFQGEEIAAGSAGSAGDIWGAYLARLNIGFANPKLYEYPDAFHRVACDLSGGLGSPNGCMLNKIFS